MCLKGESGKSGEKAENSPWECDPEQAHGAAGSWGGEQSSCLLLFRKQNFGNEQECTRGILFHL